MTQHPVTTPGGLSICPLDAIADGQARGFVLIIDDAQFHGFVVRQGSNVHGYVDRCPHAGLSLAEQPDDYLTPQGDMIVCAHHGALFRIGNGLCIGGPCAGKALTPWPVTVLDGEVVTV